MATTNDLKNGMTLNLDGNLVNVVEFQHVKPGKGGAFVRTKLKNVRTGRTSSTRPSGPTRPVEWPSSTSARCSTCIRDETGCPRSWTPSPTTSRWSTPTRSGTRPTGVTDSAAPYVTFYEGTAIEVELPAAVELKVTETEPASRATGLGRHQAGNGRDRGGRQGAAVRGDRRPDQGRHPLQGVPDPGAVSVPPVAHPGPAPPRPPGRARHPSRPPANGGLRRHPVRGRPAGPAGGRGAGRRHRGDVPRAGVPDAYTVEAGRRVAGGGGTRLDAPASPTPPSTGRSSGCALVDRNLLRLAAFEAGRPSQCRRRSSSTGLSCCPPPGRAGSSTASWPTSPPVRTGQAEPQLPLVAECAGAGLAGH